MSDVWLTLRPAKSPKTCRRVLLYPMQTLQCHHYGELFGSNMMNVGHFGQWGSWRLKGHPIPKTGIARDLEEA